MNLEEIKKLIDQNIDSAFDELDGMFGKSNGVYNDLVKQYVSRPENFSMADFRSKLKGCIRLHFQSDTSSISYSKKETLDNQIFRKFIFLNREEHVADLKIFCYGVRDKPKGAEVYQVRSDNCHRADWLFHRLYLEIIKEENYDFEYHDSVLIRSHLNFGEFVNDVKRKYEQKKHQSGTANVLGHLPPEKVHLIPFVIDAQKEDKHLDKFIVDFYEFWKKKTLHINCIILLAVNIRENKPSLLKRFTRKHVPSIKPNISKLRHICKGDIESLFQYELECGHFIKRVEKEEASINDFWEELCPLIGKALMQK